MLCLVIVHVWSAVEALAESRGETAGSALWHVLLLPGLIAATISTVLLVVMAVVSIRVARNRLSWERWHTIHLLGYIALALGFVHQVTGPDLAGYRIPQIAWALLYTVAFAQVLEHRVITPLRNATRHRMRVRTVVPEAHGVVSIVIEGRDLQELRADSGQFFRWRFLTPDLWKCAHPFSLSAAPTSTLLRLTVKALGNSSSALQALEPGTWVLAEGPYGAITAHRRTQRDVRLIAGGCRHHTDAGPVRVDAVATRARSPPAVPHAQHGRRHLRPRTRRDRPAPRRTRPLPAQPATGPFTPWLFHSLVPNLLDRDVYLCGPPAMATSARRLCPTPACRRRDCTRKASPSERRVKQFIGQLLLPLVVAVLCTAIGASARDWGTLRYPHVQPVTPRRLCCIAAIPAASIPAHRRRTQAIRQFCRGRTSTCDSWSGCVQDRSGPWVAW